MPAIPTSWSNAQFSNTTFAGMRGDTQITQLESGYVLVVWLETGSALGTAGQPPAGDIIGRIF